MIQVNITRISDNTINWSAQFPDSQSAQSWIDAQIANNSWGKPDRWCAAYPNGDGTYYIPNEDIVKADQTRIITTLPGLTETQYHFPAEYSVAQIDIGNAPILARVKAERDAKLAACDWTQLADSPLGSTTKAAWAAYRTQLRQLPDTVGFDPTNFSWPVAPV